ncbi:hypothetical protein FHT86_002175 [Rhizobium sp. BK313]|uniref:hypothetical protein n=1 Tax=Rhizobium sp. BK313 TaxID=2587081 RepID=UPI00161E6C29|nr:hypothetical protein [Rhizobium sp. BK313]MBB3453919.1 hypothetical protein [Rhizobium sp. BK313]
MKFEEAFTLYGPDVEKIAEAMGIKPHKADRLINAAMNKRYEKAHRPVFDPAEYRRQNNLRLRAELREIRRRFA